ncbi:hypothetical protein MCOR27_000357 [Pyricularia oryzae]|uniref:CENP-V/GFA domain-containing protein n=4 Tax=Pyricularia TaxID=48558 RepID=A0ABQ8NR09_PYRGI|nr:uncharacterized protein MGG_06088 [Pyricularia oryzae 70-15]KAH8847395.1 hypothetical protein MCOR01_000828 [Pyricularia oryzae]KAI6300883.1 hypothetical protein MCOR33_003508 [Pyricularia grisea]EHA52146.1 hypothetical protein MGG_06088 [Pyricularia oryzae 70-15]KAH9428408.1 hypothetical protein MCOR02_010961 [Pyricularia oryzae]KAI6259974.1 hypothetical protein MCOR19_003697 [Pyricularia oryzae]
MTEEKETYRGNCRCAAFVFEVTIPKIKEVEICKCSICYKKNYAFLFVDKKDLRVVKGSMEDFTTYTFGEGIMKHMFCPKCSMMTVCTHGKFPDQYVVNARSLQGPVDIWNMPKTVDPGKEHKPDYVPPDDSDLPEPKAEIEGESKIYHGSCHCGDIRVKLKMEPVEKFKGMIGECNCSLCHRSGVTWIYSNRPQVTISPDWSSDKFSMYGEAGAKLGEQYFCKRCGVYVANRVRAVESDEEFAKLPAEIQSFLADKRQWQPLNLRIFDGIDVDSDQVEVKRVDGYNLIKPEYVNP